MNEISVNKVTSEAQLQKFEKATIYTTSEFMGNVTKTEVRRGEIEVKPYAQYAEAIHVKFVPKGARKLRGFVKSHKPYVIVLEGHGHPDPDSLYGAYRETQDGEAAVASGRYRSFDPRWVEDFEASLNEYLEDKRDAVVFDRREK